MFNDQYSYGVQKMKYSEQKSDYFREDKTRTKEARKNSQQRKKARDNKRQWN